MVLIASGGAWQIMKGLVKGLLFVLPYSAFDAVRSTMPPLAAADDAAALKALRRMSVLKGGVPLPMFRYLCGNPSKASFNLALEAAEYLDAAHVRGRGEETKIVPGLHIARLAAAMQIAKRESLNAKRGTEGRKPERETPTAESNAERGARKRAGTGDSQSQEK
jgi:hypothetical protein